jgi:hypothetical protein
MVSLFIDEWGMATVAQFVRKKVERMPSGKVFDYSTFSTQQDDLESIAQALSRLTRKGIIERLEKGKYYKPENSMFGKLRPSESEIITTLTLKNKELIGYPTGYPVYNEMGLTTQLSNTLVIATSTPKERKTIQGRRIRFVKRAGRFLEKDIPLRQILDAIQDINIIPDSRPDKTIPVLKARIATLTEKEQERLVVLAELYQPRARVLLGAIFEQYFPKIDISVLRKKINRLSIFDIRVSNTTLPNKSSWNIR